jgi:hypothetical protein
MLIVDTKPDFCLGATVCVNNEMQDFEKIENIRLGE